MFKFYVDSHGKVTQNFGNLPVINSRQIYAAPDLLLNWIAFISAAKLMAS